MHKIVSRSVAPRIDDPVGGIVLLIVAMACFSVSDTAGKYLSHLLPPVEIVWLRYTGFTLLMVPAVLRGGRSVLVSTRPGLQIARGIGMLGSAGLFLMALRYLPIAEATATAFASPFFITALSIPILGEKVGLRRWVAVGVGLAGVLIIVRPGSGAFQPASLLPVFSAASWACGVVITRKVSGADGAGTALLYTSCTGMAVTSLMLPFFWVTPTLTQLALGGLVSVASTLAQLLLVLAYRRADASVLAPFAYTQLIWATGLGVLVFSAIPSRWTFVGAAVIIVSGVYTAHRERLRTRVVAVV